MMRKARAGHIYGGSCFGYTNTCSSCARPIPAGVVRCCKSGHTDRVVHEQEAAIVRRSSHCASMGMA